MVVYKFLAVLLTSSISLFLFFLLDSLKKANKKEAVLNFSFVLVQTMVLVGLIVYNAYVHTAVVAMNLPMIWRQIFAYLIVISNGLNILTLPYFGLNIYTLMSDFENSKTRLIELTVYWLGILSFSAVLNILMLFL